MAIAERTLTLEEFLQLPEEEPALEYHEGVVTQKVSPKIVHGRLQSRVSELFNSVAETRGLGMAFSETRFIAGGASFVPDVSYYRKDRIPLSADGGFLEEDFRVLPDIAVEIGSPDQRISVLVRKCLAYAEMGVPISLLVDPQDRSVFDIRPGAPTRALRGDDRIELGDVLPGLELTASGLFDLLRPRWVEPAEAVDEESSSTA
jgi:Uma2 family endonuclease